MINPDKFCKEIFTDISFDRFNELALMAFRFQYSNNIVYRKYCDLLNIIPSAVTEICKIPFLPVSFFKTDKVVSTKSNDYTVFTSSSTTGSIPSKHFVSNTDIYKTSFLQTFNRFYGIPDEYTIIALLPSYLERTGSSLIYMVSELINISKKEDSGFFLNDFESLNKLILKLEQQKQKYMLIGVSFSLLDFAEKFNPQVKNGIIMETGGMKGRRKEITRSELHETLKSAFGTNQIHSEYGMTELLSQAYSKENGIYVCPPWMKALVRDINDPLLIHTHGTGSLNVIDLANIFSCCFIETSDLGKVDKNGSFTVSGRFDYADVRGCSLMML